MTVRKDSKLRSFAHPRRMDSEGVTLFRYRNFFACKLIVFSATFCEKSIKSQPLRMTAEKKTRKQQIPRLRSG